MRLLVQKYGGTSVGTLAKIENVAHHISETLSECGKILVVVSAMGNYTDELIGQAKQLHSNPPKRELDILVTTGERISMSLLGIALHKRNISAMSLTGSQCGILTNEMHGNARIDKIIGSRITQGFETHDVVIVAGFQGVSPKTKDITSLGRGGSDLTAVALAITLKAEKCEIYTDVDGVYTCDPRVVKDAQLVKQISWQKLAKMTWAGICVLHHRAAFLASKFKLELSIKNSLRPKEEGTMLNHSSLEEPVVSAIGFKRQQTLLSIQIPKSKRLKSFFSSLPQLLWSLDESPHIFQQLMTSCGGMGVTLVLDEQCSKVVCAELEKIRREDFDEPMNIDLSNKMATISIVGQGFRQNPKLVEDIIDLVEDKIKLTEFKDTNINLLVEEDVLESCLNILHDYLFGSQR